MFALREIAAGLFGLNIRGSRHLGGAFGDWFPLSLLLLGVSATAWLVAGWLAPWRHRVRQEALDRQLADELVSTWGVDTLAPFVLRADKSYFFGNARAAFLAYRVVGCVAIVSGDPIGPEAELDDLVDAFVAFAHRRDWRVAILGASEQRLELYRRHGLHALYHGDEAIVETSAVLARGPRHPQGSPVEPSARARRLRRAGHAAERARMRSFARELQAIADTWRGTQPERGFAMAMDALFTLGDDQAVFVVGFGPDGRPGGFLHFAASRAGSALSLSSMPRMRTTPNGFNEWLICNAIAWAREAGYSRVSLNFAPFAALLTPEAQLSASQEVQRRALLRLKGHFQLDNLLLFNRKFLPGWERRFVVYERRLDLPRVGIAALAAEAYLPFQSQHR